MHTTVMSPSVQEPMFDFRADESLKYAHDLSDFLTDHAVSRGPRLAFTGFPSLTETQSADNVEAESDVGTSSKPCKRRVAKYIYKDCINIRIGSDDEESPQLFCPHCDKALV